MLRDASLLVKLPAGMAPPRPFLEARGGDGSRLPGDLKTDADPFSRLRRVTVPEHPRSSDDHDHDKWPATGLEGVMADKANARKKTGRRHRQAKSRHRDLRLQEPGQLRRCS